MKPQRPGDLVLFEEYVYLVIPNRPTDPANYVEMTRNGEGVLNDVRPYLNIRMASRDLTRVTSIDQFTQALHRGAVEAAIRFKDDAAYCKRLGYAAVMLANAVNAHLTAGKAVWFAADRLFTNPDRVSVTVGS